MNALDEFQGSYRVGSEVHGGLLVSLHERQRSWRKAKEMTNYGEVFGSYGTKHGLEDVALGGYLVQNDDELPVVILKTVEGLMTGMTREQLMLSDKGRIDLVEAKYVVAAGVRMFSAVMHHCNKPINYPRDLVWRCCVMLALKYMVVYVKQNIDTMPRLKPDDVTSEVFLAVELFVLRCIDNNVKPFCEDPNQMEDHNIFVARDEYGDLVVTDQWRRHMGDAVLVLASREGTPGTCLFWVDRHCLPLWIQDTACFDGKLMYHDRTPEHELRLHMFAPRVEVVLQLDGDVHIQRMDTTTTEERKKYFVIMEDKLRPWNYVCAMVGGTTNCVELAMLLGKYDVLRRRENGSCVHVYDHWAFGFDEHMESVPESHGYVPAEAESHGYLSAVSFMESKCTFVPAESFTGTTNQEGIAFVYKFGAQGLGYYRDVLVHEKVVVNVVSFREWLCDITRLCPLTSVEDDFIIANTEVHANSKWPLCQRLGSETSLFLGSHKECPIAFTGLSHPDEQKQDKLHTFGALYELYRMQLELFHQVELKNADWAEAALTQLHARMRAVVGDMECIMTERRSLEREFASSPLNGVFQLGPWAAWVHGMLTMYNTKAKAAEKEAEPVTKKAKTE